MNQFYFKVLGLLFLGFKKISYKLLFFNVFINIFYSLIYETSLIYFRTF